MENKVETFNISYSFTDETTYDEILNKFGLNFEQTKLFQGFSNIIKHRIKMYSRKWGSFATIEDNILKDISVPLLEIRKSNNETDYNEFVGKLFGKHMDIVRTVTKKGHHIGSKSDEFGDVLSELYAANFFLKKGYTIDLSRTKLKSGKHCEFWITMQREKIAIEVKNLNNNNTQDYVHGETVFEDGKFVRRNQREYSKIKNKLRRQFKLANNKFKDGRDLYSIVLIVPLPIAVLGQPTLDYINKIFNQNHSVRMVDLIIMDSHKTYHRNYYSNYYRIYKNKDLFNL